MFRILLVASELYYIGHYNLFAYTNNNKIKNN